MELNRNIYKWIKEIRTIDVSLDINDSRVNELLKDHWQIVNQRSEKLTRFKVTEVAGKETLIMFEVMITRYVMGK